MAMLEWSNPTPLPNTTAIEFSTLMDAHISDCDGIDDKAADGFLSAVYLAFPCFGLETGPDTAAKDDRIRVFRLSTRD
jgi:hypothetical protein